MFSAPCLGINIRNLRITKLQDRVLIEYNSGSPKGLESGQSRASRDNGTQVLKCPKYWYIDCPGDYFTLSYRLPITISILSIFSFGLRQGGYTICQNIFHFVDYIIYVKLFIDYMLNNLPYANLLFVELYVCL